MALFASRTTADDANETTHVASGKYPERLSRRLLESRLSGLRAGRLTMIDGAATRTFGSQLDPPGLEAEVRVHDPRFYSDTVFGGSTGAAEAFMRGYWSCNDLSTLLRLLVVNSDVNHKVHALEKVLKQPVQKVLHFLRRNTVSGSQENIAAHYDLGNDFFSLFLDQTMMYSGAFFANPDSSLTEAQTAKIDRVCQKLQLQPGDQLLEIGTGWGGFAIHAASRYGCQVTTTTISPAQFELAVRRVADAGLADRVRVIQEDYRALKGQYDKLASIEMIEAVGHAFLDQYFGTCSKLLKPTGQMVIQAITMLDQDYDEYLRNVDFIQRYIFPGGCLPSLSAIALSVKRATDLQLFNAEDLTSHYARTLQCWRSEFFKRIEEVRALGYPESFIRMWDFYLCYCEAAFLERRTQLLQFMFVKPKCRRSSMTPNLDAIPLNAAVA